MTVALPILDTAIQRPVYAVGPRSLSAVQLLRISVTDRCNLRCQYCMPMEGVPFSPQEDLLSVREILAVAAAARQVGVSHFKITGGEPTIRRDILEIVHSLNQLQPHDLSMTTNGLNLAELAGDLKEAGLDRLTVSLDSLHADRFNRITGGHAGQDALNRVLKGIEAAQTAGFEKLKINMVVIGGVNDDEVGEFASLTVKHPWTVRFIEYMPLGHSALTDHSATTTVDNETVARRITEQLGPLTPVHRESEAGVGPAAVFSLPRARGRIGFISAMSRPFCETCNRLRLTATGELRACLFDGGEVDVKPALQPPADMDRLIALMRLCVATKPLVHSDRGNRAMSQMGG